MNACLGEKGLPSHIATTWNYRWGFYGGSETFTWDLLHKASRGAVRRGIHYLLPRSFAGGRGLALKIVETPGNPKQSRESRGLPKDFQGAFGNPLNHLEPLSLQLASGPSRDLGGPP